MNDVELLNLFSELTVCSNPCRSCRRRRHGHVHGDKDQIHLQVNEETMNHGSGEVRSQLSSRLYPWTRRGCPAPGRSPCRLCGHDASTLSEARINTDFGDQWLILQRLSRSTKFSYFRTACNSRSAAFSGMSENFFFANSAFFVFCNFHFLLELKCESLQNVFIFNY